MMIIDNNIDNNDKHAYNNIFTRVHVLIYHRDSKFKYQG